MKATFEQVFGAVVVACRAPARGDDEVLDRVEALVHACGWTPDQYAERLAEARRRGATFRIDTTPN